MTTGLVQTRTVAQLAIKHLESGDLSEAGRLLDILLRQRPHHVQGLLARLWLDRRAGNRDRARTVAETLLALEGDPGLVPRVIDQAFGPRLGDRHLEAYLGSPHGFRSEIADHIPTLFYESLITRPRLIVELGTQRGESTRALMAVAARTGASLLTVDIDDCRFPIPGEVSGRCTFVQADDVAYGRDEFVPWARARGLEPLIDVLFIDTSHLLEHTRQEIATWMPFLRSGGVALFHDTNMGLLSQRLDGTYVDSWDNGRGVIGPIEEFVGLTIDETRPAVHTTADWVVTHVPWSSGFTVLRSLRSA